MSLIESCLKKLAEEYKHYTGLAQRKEVLEEVLDLLQQDPHQWSERPCPTCRAISQLASRDFGCSLWAIQVGKLRKEAKEEVADA